MYESIKQVASVSKMTDEEKERVSHVLSKQEEMLDSRKSQLDRWEDNIQRQQFEKTTDEDARKLGRSNLRIPLEFAFVESKTTDEIDTLPFPKILPDLKKGSIKNSNIFQQVFDHVLYNVLNINEVLFRMHIQKNTLGDSILKIYWKKEERIIKTPIKKNKKTGEIEFKEETITVYDDIFVELVDLRNFLIDPITYQAGKTLDDANFCQFVTLYDFHAFKKIFGDNPAYKNVDMVPSSRLKVRDESIQSKPEAQGAPAIENYVEVSEHWDVLNDELIVVANNIEIRHSSVPYMNPFTKIKRLPIAHFVGHLTATGFYNKGEIDIVKDLAEERETQRNINIDAAKAYTHPFLLMGGNNDFDVDDFVIGINSITNVEDINQVKQITMSGNTGLPFNLEAANQNDAVIATGHDVAGVLGGAGETATRTLEKKETQIKRTRMTTTYNELNGYHRLYSLIKDLMLQFYDPKKVTSILGKNVRGEFEILDISGGDNIFKENYDLSIVANNQLPASREIKKVRNQEALATLSALPINPETGDIPELLKPAVKVVLMGTFEVPEDEADRRLKIQTGAPEEGDDGQAELNAAIENAKAAGVPLEGGEDQTGGFKRGGTPAASVQPGIQAQIQSQVQPLTP